MAKYLDNTGLTSLWAKIKTLINGKQDAPATTGTSGQVLTLNSNLQPTWATPSGGSSAPEIFIGSTTPEGYTLYIDPDGGVTRGEGVGF